MISSRRDMEYMKGRTFVLASCLYNTFNPCYGMKREKRGLLFIASWSIQTVRTLFPSIRSICGLSTAAYLCFRIERQCFYNLFLIRLPFAGIVFYDKVGHQHLAVLVVPINRKEGAFFMGRGEVFPLRSKGNARPRGAPCLLAIFEELGVLWLP